MKKSSWIRKPWKLTTVRLKLPPNARLGPETTKELRKQIQVPKRKIDLHRKAWRVFGNWVKKRDKHICITCGDRNANQAGHFWHGVLDFDEMNISAQCKTCNHFKSGNLAIYATYLLNKYGLKKFQDLEVRHYLAMKGEYRTEQNYLDLISKYKV